MLVDSQLKSPITVRDQQIGAGSKSLTLAIAKTAFPVIEDMKFSEDGERVPVLFSDLQVTRKVAPANGVAPPAKLSVHINEFGQVFKVFSMNSSPVAPEVEQAIRKWEFAVYTRNGQPTKVITTVQSTDW